jgi:GNAT superfamily N-acetyltransferase
MLETITTTYLEMTDRCDFRPSGPSAIPFLLMQTEVPCPEFSQFLYGAVGARWRWRGRLAWDYAQWQAWLDRPALETWVGYVSGTPAGYFELEQQESDAVEIVHFGLMPRFIGKGMGGPLLTATIKRAWDMGAKRVWVHTCTKDHPHAVRNYQARGFRVYRTEEQIEDVPDHPFDPWPGANLPTR